MKLSDSVTIPSHVIAQKIGEETVILDLESGTYFGLDSVGARTWDLLSEHHSLEKVCDLLIAEFDVHRETLENDLLLLCGNLLAKRLAIIAK